MGYMCWLGVGFFENLLYCKLREGRFFENKYRASLGGAVRAQYFDLSNMKPVSLKVWGMQHRSTVVG